MDPRKTHYVGQLQRPKGKPENVELFIEVRGEPNTIEAGNGIKAVDGRYKPGDALRYFATIDGTTDDTQAFQDAVNSGFPAFCDVSGTTNIEGTVTLNGDKTLKLNAELNFERQSGSATTPMIHMYGNKNVLDPQGATIRQDLYAHSDGIIRIGPAAGETESGTTDVQCYGNQIASHFKMLGSWGVGGQDGSVGVYIESIRRKLFTVRNPTYDTHIESGEILNCDIGAVMSTDVNRSDICLLIRQFGTAAIIMNGCYGNKLDLHIETLQAVTPEVWREAIHFGTQNYLSTESGTSASYTITAAWRNYLNVYAELSGSGTSKARLINFNEPGSSANEGYNDLVTIGQFGGGIGEDGTTTSAGLGTNKVESSVTIADFGRPWKIHGYEFRMLDDDSGGIWVNESRCRFGNRKASMVEDFSYDLFEIDNVGSTNDAISCTLCYSGKQTGTDDENVTGEIAWHFPVRGGSAQDALEIYHHRSGQTTSDAYTEPFHFVVATAAGTGGSTGKFTVSVATRGTPSDFNGFLSWDVKLISANSESVSNLDWSADVSLLTSSTSGAVTNPIKSQRTRYKTGNETRTTTTTLADDNDFIDYVLDPDTLYLLDGDFFLNEAGTADFRFQFIFTSSPQEIRIILQSTGNRSVVTSEAVANLTTLSDDLITASGYFRTHATLESTVKLQWAQAISSGTSTLYKGSNLKIMKARNLLTEN